MASVGTLTVNGMVFPVVLLSSSAQAIDNTVNVLGAPTTPQAALSALGAGVRTNLLDNAYFVGPIFPVNQLNQTSYSGIVSCWDRWRLNNAQATLIKSGDQWTLTNGDPSVSRNVLYQTVADLSAVTGKTVTVSLLYAGSGTAGCTLYGDSGSFQGGSLNGANGFATTTISIPSTLSNYLRIQILIAAGSSIVPIAMKLEEGHTQTLAYQDSTGAWHRLPQPEDGDYAGQLLKCQRYLVPLPYGASNNFAPIGFGFAISSSQVRILIPTPVFMRANPTVQFLSGSISGITLLGGGTAISPTSISNIVAFSYGVAIDFAVSGATANTAYTMRMTNAYMALNAQL